MIPDFESGGRRFDPGTGYTPFLLPRAASGGRRESGRRRADARTRSARLITTRRRRERSKSSRPPRPPKKTFKKNLLISRARRSRRRHRFRIMYSNERYATPVANADPSVTPHMKWSKSVHPPPRPPPRPPPLPPSNRAFSATAFYSARSDDVGAESKGVRGGVERHRGVSGSKARDLGRRETRAGEKVLKKRRSPRERGRTGTGVR